MRTIHMTMAQLKTCMSHLEKSICHLQDFLQVFPNNREIVEAMRTLCGRYEDFAEIRMELNLRTRRIDTGFEYTCSWWFYPEEKNYDEIPEELVSWSDSYSYEIDAVVEACQFGMEEGLFRRDQAGFFVLHLRTNSPDVFFLLKTGMTTYRKDGSLPDLSQALSPDTFEGCDDMLDAIYKAHADMLEEDDWDGPHGVPFILLITGGM